MEEKERAYWERQQVTDAAVQATADRQVPWADSAYLAVVMLAVQRPYITSDDVWERLDALGKARPDEPRAMGAVMRRAVKEKALATTDRTQQSKRAVTAGGKKHHTTPVRVYLSLMFRA